MTVATTARVGWRRECARRAPSRGRRRERAVARTRGDERGDEGGATKVFVFVNKKSGGRRGREVLRRLRETLKPPHVVLDATKVRGAIDRGEVDWDAETRVLVAGGDGTVGTVVDALRRRRREPPPIAIAPLGTGNDLARVLGWSGDVWDDSRLFSERRVVSTLRRARLQRVDRWSLEITRPRRRSTTKKLFSNYMGIGVDARAALAFDSARKDRRWTWLFVHALTNKLLYAVFGARDFIEHSFAGLKRDVEVTVDGKVIDFPEDTEGIILLNINSFSGGVRMWATSDEFTKSLKDDGVLEIVAVSGALHLGQLNARLAKPVQVAQGCDVRIELKRDLPVQIDGEPWLQRGAATLRVSLNDSFTMLRRPRQDRINDLLARWSRSNGFASEDDDATSASSDERRARRRRAFAFAFAFALCLALAAFVFPWRHRLARLFALRLGL